MQTLVERLMQATGPDRELDWDIRSLCYANKKSPSGPPRHYTESIDSALTLVPPNHWWSLHSEDVDGAGDVMPPGARVVHFGDRLRTGHRVNAATPALALCAAALKARDGR